MKIGIIGFGHLGKAFTKSLITQAQVMPQDIFITAKSEKTQQEAKKEYSVNVCHTNQELLKRIDVVFLAISKAVFIKELQDINETYSKIMVSFMAGVPIKLIQNSFPLAIVSRAMPNIGIADGNGMIGYTVSDPNIIALYKKMGSCFQVEENDIEKVTAFSACGLGFAAYILTAFQEAGEKFGFDRSTSKNISANIFSNAIEAEDFKKLATEVATNGGATEQGLLHFDRMNMKKIIEDAVNKAYSKANE